MHTKYRLYDSELKVVGIPFEQELSDELAYILNKVFGPGRAPPTVTISMAGVVYQCVEDGHLPKPVSSLGD